MARFCIGLEGIDGSGKTEQLKRLKALLESRGASVETLSFPAYERFFGSEIGKLLSGDHPLGAEQLDPKSTALWYAMDRWDAFRSLPDSDYLLLNRYTLSNVVYQTARAGEPVDGPLGRWIRDLEHRVLGLPEPDVYVILDVSPTVSAGNVAAKGHRDYVGEQADLYERSSTLLMEARVRYREASSVFSRAVLVDCLDADGALRPIEEIQGEIVALAVK